MQSDIVKQVVELVSEELRTWWKWNLLCLGFKEQIYDVYRYLPPATQVVLISATLPHEILEMTNKFMTDPIRILVKR